MKQRHMNRATILIENAQQEQRNQQAARALRDSLRHPFLEETGTDFLQMLAKVLDVVPGEPAKQLWDSESALVKALCETSARSTLTNRQWGCDGDREHAGSMRDCRLICANAAARESKSFSHGARDSFQRRSRITTLACELDGSVYAKSISPAKGSISRQEEAKLWWAEKVAKERQMVQKRKSLALSR